MSEFLSIIIPVYNAKNFINRFYNNVKLIENAEFIFVLCILEPEKQIDVLKSLVEALSNEEIMNGIKSAKTPDEVYDLLIYED
mgnify:CR=1 FL=1